MESVACDAPTPPSSRRSMTRSRAPRCTWALVGDMRARASFRPVTSELNGDSSTSVLAARAVTGHLSGIGSEIRDGGAIGESFPY
jgi:hypothetical protein